MVAKTHLTAPTMTTAGEYMQRATNTVLVKREIVVHPISRRNNIIVVAKHNKCPWCGMAHIHIGTIFTLIGLTGKIAQKMVLPLNG